MPRPVSVIAYVYAVAIILDKFCLRLRERRAHARNRRIEARLMKRYHVHVAFGHDYVLEPFGLLALFK